MAHSYGPAGSGLVPNRVSGGARPTASPSPSPRVLLPGSGLGRLAWEVAAAGYRVVGWRWATAGGEPAEPEALWLGTAVAQTPSG